MSMRTTLRAARPWRAIAASMLLIERDRLALWLPVCLGAGDTFYFLLRREPPLWPAALLLLGGPILFGLGRRYELARILAAVVAAAALGFLAAAIATQRSPPMPVLPRTASVVSGRIAAVDLFADGSRRLTFAEPAINADPPIARRQLRIRLRDDDLQPIAVGDRVRLRAMLRAPPPPSRPGGRDMQREAFFSGQAGSGSALGLALIDAHASGEAGTLQRLRETIAARIAAILPGPRGAIAATLLTGISSAIPPADRAAFAVAGLAHLLAVAGLHLAIVMGLVMGMVRMALALWEYAALRLPTREIAAVAALGAGLAYMALTGMHLPTERSLAMGAFAVLALLIGRRAVSLRGLGVAAVLLLVRYPVSVMEVSFQMSFAAVLALIAGYEALRPVLTRLYGDGAWYRRPALHVAGLFLTSLLAGAASLPYAAYHFGHVQFYFVLANLVAVPLTAFWVLPEGLLALALMPFGLERLALVPMGWGIGVILWLARTVAGLPAASLAVRAMPLWGLGLVSGGLVWLCLRRGYGRLLGLLPLCAGMATLWLCRPPDLLVSPDGRLIALRIPGPAGARFMIEEGAGASPLVLADWKQSQAIETPLSYMPEGLAEGPVADGPVTCTAVSCLIALRGQAVLLLRAGTAHAVAGEPLDCKPATLLVSPIPAHRNCPGLPRIDRFTVWREGAHSVWIGPGRVTVVSDRQMRGQRPWIPVPGRRRVPALPMARTE